jgi:hypothetical protein
MTRQHHPTHWGSRQRPAPPPNLPFHPPRSPHRSSPFPPLHPIGLVTEERLPWRASGGNCGVPLEALCWPPPHCNTRPISTSPGLHDPIHSAAIQAFPGATGEGFRQNIENRVILILDLPHGGVLGASGSSAFAGANAERSTVEIDPSHSFLIVRLRSIEMHSTLANTVYNIVANSWYCITRWI